METFTAFCQEKGASGTIWIDQVEAENASLATLEAGLKCAADWGFEPCDVWVLGIAHGNVEILIWEDQGVP